VYSEKSPDRISILRNLTSIFLCEECNASYYELLLIKSKSIYKSVLENFELYFKENVKQYFTERSKVKETITNRYKDIANEINSIIDTMNKNLITTIGLVLGAIVGYIAKPNIIIIKVAAVCYIAFLIISGTYFFTYYRYRLYFIVNDFKDSLESF